MERNLYTRTGDENKQQSNSSQPNPNHQQPGQLQN